MNGTLLRLITSWAGWVTAEWAFLVLLSVVAYARAGAAGVGLAGAARMLPAAVLSPFGALLLDRWSRVRVLVLVHAGEGALMLGLAAAVTHNAPLPVVLAAAAATSGVGSVFRPAFNALTPQLVRRPEELITANAVAAAIEAAGVVLGPLLAGALAALLGPGAALAALAGVFGVCAGVTSTIRSSARPSVRPAPRSRFSHLSAGFVGLFGEPGVRTIVGLALAQTTMRGMVNVFVVLAALTVFHTGEAGAGALFAAMGVGGVAGAVASFGLAGRRRLAVPFAAGVAMWGLPVVGIALWPAPTVTTVMLVLVGLGNAMQGVSGFTLLQRLLPNALVGRAFGVFWGCAFATMAAGSLAAPVLVALLGTRGAMAGSGIVLTVAAAVTCPRLRRLERAADVPERPLELLRATPLFAPLPGVTLERVARALRPLVVPLGTTLIRQGDVGDTFYVIDEGTFTAHQDGTELRRMAPGDFFGEIALLRATRRTTTVTAVTDASVYELAAAEFLAAVTGDAAAVIAADGVVEYRTGSR